jgi:hypothetical protein
MGHVTRIGDMSKACQRAIGIHEKMRPLEDIGINLEDKIKRILKKSNMAVWYGYIYLTMYIH